MKKIKIMLMSLAILAVVGGALAFKAKGPTRYCITNAVKDVFGNFTCPANLACPLDKTITTADPQLTFMCTTTFNAGCVQACTTKTPLLLTPDH